MRTTKEIAEQISHDVIKSNDLIQRSRFSLSTQQQKIILYLISKIKPFEEPHPYVFRIKDFCRVCGLDDTQGYYYRTLKDELKKLRDKSVWIKLPNGDEVTAGWLSKVKISQATGNVYIDFDVDMLPFLFGLKEQFTRYSLEYVLAMRSKYAIRLYELIKSHEWQGKTFKTLEDLKIRMDALNYDRWQDFRRYALEPAVEEINKYSDIFVSWNELKEGRKVARIVFNVVHVSGEEINRRREKRWEKLGIEI